MKQLLILSGKGGTGKTTIASSFIELSKAKAFADCDVEAPNLHLINRVGTKKSKPYYGMAKAYIDEDKCDNCGLCKENCRFDAIEINEKHHINPYICEGCSVCQYVCPQNAIEMIQTVDGETTIHRDNYIFSTAELKMGSGNSGHLVTEVKQQLLDNTTDEPIAIIDGSPGIGCPVIASLSGVDMVLIVTEPTLSGISDLERILKTAKVFRVKTAVCVNKSNLNFSLTRKIEKYTLDNDIAFLGVIPYDSRVVEIINEGRTIVSEDFEVSKAIKNVYLRTMEVFFE
ncbi:ATP-binding protein [Mycoplasmatota bacterium WC30]